MNEVISNQFGIQELLMILYMIVAFVILLFIAIFTFRDKVWVVKVHCSYIDESFQFHIISENKPTKCEIDRAIFKRYPTIFGSDLTLSCTNKFKGE